MIPNTGIVGSRDGRRLGLPAVMMEERLVRHVG